ncbi:hypothetical protein COHA_003836 [Chlorella ohadii]|uniref:Uncharacterized protein n=1 Tax=Chlorella ohadii TaxID=2649997 RepID=A0AAD5H7M3_9CHLO|nr:hypothetical protein COHA_003836 [Chlorella ohadii]
MASRPPAEPAPSELNTQSLTFLEVGKDKLSVRYNGPAQHDNDVGSIQSNNPVPLRRLVYYFEITVKEASGGSISLGFSDRNFKQGRHPGFEPHSYGYRGDTGRKHHSTLPVRGEEYGPSFGPGDVIGAGIHLTKHEIFFTKNGEHLGVAFRNVGGHPLFPTIGLHSQGAKVEVNFGRQPFHYDWNVLVAREEAAQQEALHSTSVSAGEVHQIVRDYLLHYGYADTLAAFDTAAGMAEAEANFGAAAADALQPSVAAVQQQQQQGAASPPAAAAAGGSGGGSSAAHEAALLPLRAQLRQQLMAGDTAAAQALLQQHAPELLAAAASSAGAAGTAGGGFELRFHLACQHYIELIRRGDIIGALGYAEGPLSTLRGASLDHDARLRDVVALIAYQQPEQSPLSALLAPAQREATADVVNAALLRSRLPAGTPEPQAALELVLRQLSAAQVRWGGPAPCWRA